MNAFIVPQSVGQNLARAKSLLRRDDPMRALDALITGLELYEPTKLMGKVRFEVEVLIQECIGELNRQPMVRKLLESLTKSTKVGIAYAPGQEEKLRALLGIVRKALQETEAAGTRQVEEERQARKDGLRDKGLAYLQAGDAARGKGALRVLGDEFGEESGVLAEIGLWLLEYKLHFEAVEFLEQSMEAFPKESKAYAPAADAYLFLREYEKAEAVYQKAVREFGKHPKTMMNLANLYVLWGKKDKAFETARDVVAKDPQNSEAQAMVDKYA